MIIEDYFYDTEFDEDGPHMPIAAISIGIRRKRGGEPYYAVFDDFDMHHAWHKAGPNRDYWLRENVLKKLPLLRREDGSIWLDGDGTPILDSQDPAVKSRHQIKQDLTEFFELDNPDLKRRLWAWYADYDHVVLSQVWGTMVQLPRGMPMFTHDLKQIVDLAGNPDMPKQPAGEHHALDDAAHLETMWQYCVYLGLMKPPPVFAPKTAIKPLRVRDNPQA